MASHTSIRAGLVLALTLAAGIVTDAQTNWPTAKTRTAASKSATLGKRSKPAPRKRRTRRKPVASAAAPRTNETELLRSMAELVTRQAAAIEALARRLEAAEARLEVLASAAEPAPHAVAEIVETQAPFRAALAIDWSEVLAP